MFSFVPLVPFCRSTFYCTRAIVYLDARLVSFVKLSFCTLFLVHVYFYTLPEVPGLPSAASISAITFDSLLGSFRYVLILAVALAISVFPSFRRLNNYWKIANKSLRLSRYLLVLVWIFPSDFRWFNK